MILKLTRAYHIRHVMVEGGYITPQQFLEEILQLIQDEGMLPPKAELKMGGQTYTDHYWEKE